MAFYSIIMGNAQKNKSGVFLMDDIKKEWPKILEIIKEEYDITDTAFHAFLEPLTVSSVENDTILSSAPLSFRAPQARGTSLYRNFDIQWQRSVDASTGNRKLSINLEFSENSDGFKLTAINENVSISLQCQKDIAKNPEKALENIRTKLSQWGDTKFSVENIDIQLDTIYFIPASVLGEMKRQLVAELESSFRLKHNEVKRNGEIHKF